LSKELILTNMFILAYFLSTGIILFLFELFQTQNFLYILFYNILLVIIFLNFADIFKKTMGELKKFKFSLFFVMIIVGLVFGILFMLTNEPVSGSILDVYSDSLFMSILKLLAVALFIGVSEQLIFSGFFYNMYSKITTPETAAIYSAFLFALFHFTNVLLLFGFYLRSDIFSAYLFSAIYFVLLFIFMLTAIYFYRIDSKKYKGNILYPIMLHFATDFFLFLFYYLGFR